MNMMSNQLVDYPEFHIRTVPVNIDNKWKYKICIRQWEYCYQNGEIAREIESYIIDIEMRPTISKFRCYSLKEVLNLCKKIGNNHCYVNFGIGYFIYYTSFSHTAVFSQNPEVPQETILNKIANLITNSVVLNLDIRFAYDYCVLIDNETELTHIPYEW